MGAARYLLCDLCAEEALGTDFRRVIQGTGAEFREWSRRTGGPAAAWPASMAAEAATAHEPEIIFLLVDKSAYDEAHEYLAALRRLGCPAPVVLVMGDDRTESLTPLLEAGATDFLLAPLREPDVLTRLERWRPRPAVDDELARTLKERLGLRQFVGESPQLLAELRKLARFSRCDAVVLIQGETGTGKEVCARAIHYLSQRSSRPFVAVNSGAIPPDLLENELFGHEAGAFTGARGAQRGVIADAEGGTLFLDEIDSLPLSAQVKVLRFLQEKEYRPLGGRRVMRADVRVIAATNQRIRELLAGGQFRADLYYRLNVLPLALPPLRERRDDIPALARHFLGKHAGIFGRAGTQFAVETLQLLKKYDWPGNIRELENVVERALLLTDAPVILPQDLDLPVAADADTDAEPRSFRESKSRVVAEFERRYVIEMLERHGGNISHAATAARKNRRAFFQLVRKHRVKVEAATAPDGSRSVKIAIRQDKSVQPRLSA